VLSGELKGEARSAVLDAPDGRIHSDPGCVALLATFASGGVGLNLAPACSAVIMLDVWWNPAVERQAIDRVHRIGCVRECDAYALRYEASFDTACRGLYHSFKTANSRKLMKEEEEDPVAGEEEDAVVLISEGAAQSLILEVASALGISTAAFPQKAEKRKRDPEQEEVCARRMAAAAAAAAEEAKRARGNRERLERINRTKPRAAPPRAPDKAAMARALLLAPRKTKESSPLIEY
jgi:hypothetical protein